MKKNLTKNLVILVGLIICLIVILFLSLMSYSFEFKIGNSTYYVRKNTLYDTMEYNRAIDSEVETFEDEKIYEKVEGFASITLPKGKYEANISEEECSSFYRIPTYDIPEEIKYSACPLELEAEETFLYDGVVKIKEVEELELIKEENIAYSSLDSLNILKLYDHDYVKTMIFDYSDIETIDNLEGFSNLEILAIENSDLSKIEGLDDLNSLYELDLSGNNIKQIEGLNGLNSLEKLNVSENNIETIENIETLPNLEILIYGDSVKYITQESYDFIKGNDIYATPNGYETRFTNNIDDLIII